MLVQSFHHAIRQISRLRPREGNRLFQGAQQVGLLTPRQCPSLYTAPSPSHCLLKQWYPIHSFVTHPFIHCLLSICSVPGLQLNTGLRSALAIKKLLWPSQLSLPVAPTKLLPHLSPPSNRPQRPRAGLLPACPPYSKEQPMPPFWPRLFHLPTSSFTWCVFQSQLRHHHLP